MFIDMVLYRSLDVMINDGSKHSVDCSGLGEGVIGVLLVRDRHIDNRSVEVAIVDDYRST